MNAPVRQHRLMAILFADVAGYSRLMALDDAATLESLDAARDVFQEHIETFGGRVIDMSGDSVLAVFNAVVSALNASLDIQRCLLEQTQEELEARRLRFRIGLHLDHVIEKNDGTVYGDGINVASRLQALADPGGIVISQAVHAEVWNSIGARFDDLGEQTLKNIDRPVRAFRATRESSQGLPNSERGAQSQVARAVAWRKHPSSQPSVAVLAFDGFSSDPLHQLLGEGFADDLITDLARNSALTVVARSTSFSMKGRVLKAQAIARELKVRYLVEGSVRRVGDEVQVNVQLLDGGDGRHIWAERFTFGTEDVYAVQSRIVGRIAATLFSGIQESEMEASLRKPPSSLDVYELTLRGAAHERQQTPEGMIAGCSELQRAIELDPQYAPAQIWLGYLIAADAVGSISGRFKLDDLPTAIARVRTGIKLDPTLALGYQALSMALSLNGELDDALIAAERAVVLGPGDADNLNFLSRIQLLVGRYDAALSNVKRAIELNPRAPPFYFAQHVRALYALDHFDEASIAARAAVLAFPGNTGAVLVGAAADVARGALGQAKAAIASVLERDPSFTLCSPQLAPLFARDPQRRLLLLDRLRSAGVRD